MKGNLYLDPDLKKLRVFFVKIEKSSLKIMA